MSYISFVRHGKSLLDSHIKIKGADVHSWVEDYNRSGIHPPSSTIMKRKELSQKESVVLSSDLKRAEDTAIYLFSGTDFERNAICREAELPDPPRLLSSVRMPASSWSVVLRVFWLCGYSRKAESVSKMRERAKEAAAYLMELSGQKDHIILVGHGFFNRMVARVLRKKGWRSETKHGNNHWEVTTFQKAE